MGFVKFVIKKKNYINFLIFFYKFKADDGIPIWWKSTTDKVLTTFVFASTVGCFVVTLSNLVKFSLGKL